jgi:hypothetical protein
MLLMLNNSATSLGAIAMPVTSFRGNDAFLEKSFLTENVPKELKLSAAALRHVD